MSDTFVAHGPLSRLKLIDLGDGSYALATGPAGKVAKVAFTRPADTTQYTIKDSISNSTSAGRKLEFTDCTLVAGGVAYLTGAMLRTSAYQATGLQARLWLYNVAPATTSHDNAEWSASDEEQENCVGYIDFNQTWAPGTDTSGAGGNAVMQVAVDKLVACATSSRTLYGVLEALNAYTPVSAESFSVQLEIAYV